MSDLTTFRAETRAGLENQLPAGHAHPHSPVVAKAAKAAVYNLVRRGEMPPDTSIPSYTQVQVMEDWWLGQNGAEA